MTVATISWDLSALTDSGMAPVESHKSLFGAASALHTPAHRQGTAKGLRPKSPLKECPVKWTEGSAQGVPDGCHGQSTAGISR
ncbi:hypothetical protein MTO96_045949 [Rhipicephalus appendiculatus]